MEYAYFKQSFASLSEAKISIMTHAFNYGTGVFEGIKGYYNQKLNQVFIFRVKEHFERMKKNCRILKIYIDKSVEELTEITVELIKKNKFKSDVYIRPIAYKSLEKIGVKLPDEYDFCIFSVPVSHYFDLEKPIKTCISSWRRVEDNAIPGRGKITGAYVNSALAAQEARDNGFDEAIFLNEDGHVSEGAAMNIFIVRNGMLHTPPISHNILEGITRDTIIEISKEELGVETVLRTIDRTELYHADEVFLCGTLSEVVSVGSIDHRPIGNGEMGNTTKKIQNLFFRVVRGEIDKYKKWLTPVY
ncbi:MAG: branched-chain amino acid transaminase [Acidobacteriota bacterium]